MEPWGYALDVYRKADFLNTFYPTCCTFSVLYTDHKAPLKAWCSRDFFSASSAASLRW